MDRRTLDVGRARRSRVGGRRRSRLDGRQRRRPDLPSLRGRQADRRSVRSLRHDPPGDPPAVAARRARRRHGPRHGGRWRHGPRRRTHRRWTAGVDGVAVRPLAARAEADRQPEPRRAGWRSESGSCVAASSVRPCRPPSNCSASAPCRARNSTCSPPSPRSATCTSRCFIRRPSPGCASPRSSSPTRLCAAGTATPRRSPPTATRCCGRGAGRAARRRRWCADCRRRSRSWRRTIRRPPARPRCSSISAPTSPPTDRRHPSCRRPTTRASRFTPATARSVSSRCSATCSVTCSSPTRRCGPTTCS